MKRPWRLVLLILLPLLLGAAAGLAVEFATANPTVYLRARLGTLVLLAGGLLSFLAAGPLVAAAWSHLRIVRARAAQDADHHNFMRRLDHEIKNPVAALQAALENLASTPSLTGAQRAIIDGAQPYMLRLRTLTRGLRHLGQLKQTPLERSTVRVARVLQEAVAMAQDLPQAQGRQIKLSVQEAPWPPEISGDHELLVVCVFNLLDNALKFSSPGTPVEVRALEVERGNTVLIEVGDRGMGIAKEEIPNLGKELYRAPEAFGKPGTGLGLALVYTVVEQHGGRIAIRSRQGEGTLVSLYLPVKAPRKGWWRWPRARGGSGG